MKAKPFYPLILKLCGHILGMDRVRELEDPVEEPEAVRSCCCCCCKTSEETEGEPGRMMSVLLPCKNEKNRIEVGAFLETARRKSWHLY